MANCLKCKCTTCEKIRTCQYHIACATGSGQVRKEYVEECKDYGYSKEIDDYINKH